MPGKSCEYLVLCWAKCASELSLKLQEIILTLDSLQWQRAFWMWYPISQLFNMDYQPTTCQTLTVKMSATKISPLHKDRWNLLSEGMNPTKLLRWYCGLFWASSFFKDHTAEVCAGYGFSSGLLSDLTTCIIPPILNKASPLSAEWQHLI